MIDPTNENIADLVEHRFRELGPPGAAVQVLHVDPKHDQTHKADWWLVRVEIDVPLSQLFSYYQLLGEVEEKLEIEEGSNTLIVPTIPEEQAVA